jgi:prepilin-type N-terminal cleavage/methylation domain-containing protein
MSHHSARGFSLIEVLVAMLLVAGAVAMLGSLGMLGLMQNDTTHDASLAVSLAQSKLDELRAVTWAYDASGAPVADAALAITAPLTPIGGGAGTSELFDRFGQPIGSTPEAIFTRRWSVTVFDPADPDTLALNACVETRTRASGHRPYCLVTLRTRQP